MKLYYDICTTPLYRLQLRLDMARLLFAVERGSGHTKSETVIHDAETTPRMEEEKKFGPITEESTFPLFLKTSARGTTEGHREQGQELTNRCVPALLKSCPRVALEFPRPAQTCITKSYQDFSQLKSPFWALSHH